MSAVAAFLVFAIGLQTAAVSAAARGAAAPGVPKQQHMQQRSPRRLQQSVTCPVGCAPESCVQDGTTPGGYRCSRCLASLQPRANGLCGCPRGTFYVAADGGCSPCARGSWCTGGPVTAEAQPAAVACPEGMTTPGLRASSINACVNTPGSYYVAGAVASSNGTAGTIGAPSAAPCPADTWSPGLRKQRGCLPCTPGYTTGGATGASSASACFVPAGYEVTDSTGVARPCPRGTYKSSSGSNGTCTACPGGVTTPDQGSQSAASCSVLLPGVYAAAMDGGAVTAARRCPQRMYCPGGTPVAAFSPAAGAVPAGDTTVVPCPNGQWTEELGAATVEQCMTPPGFVTANGTTSRCADGSYRDGWAPAEAAGACVSCGQGMFGSNNEQIDLYDPVTEAISLLPVATDSTGCYIKAGMGLYRSGSGGSAVWHARNCDANSYGVARAVYGMSTPLPCRECPAGMVASRDAAAYPRSASFFVDNGDGSGGFTDPLACVTQPGYGYNGRSSTPCPPGSYNAQDTLATCSRCPVGTSTAGPGAGVTAADCKLAPGWGATPGGGIAPCPLGTYNDAVRNDSATPCTACPAGTTTTETGATGVDDCGACLPGFGGPGCAQQCGGHGKAATFGPAGRSRDSACSPCSQSVAGWPFALRSGRMDDFAPASVSRLGAESGDECLAEFSQVVDTAWHLPYAGALTTTPGVATFAACVALCGADCQFVTYDYGTRDCGVKLASSQTPPGSPYLAWKTERSGDMAASSRRARAAGVGATVAGRPLEAARVDAKALASGKYSWHVEPAALSIGVQVPAPGAAGFTSVGDCVFACDLDNSCAGVAMESKASPADSARSCQLIYGDPRPGVYRRSMTRADVARLEIPAQLLAYVQG